MLCFPAFFIYLQSIHDPDNFLVQKVIPSLFLKVCAKGHTPLTKEPALRGWFAPKWIGLCVISVRLSPEPTSLQMHFFLSSAEGRRFFSPGDYGTTERENSGLSRASKEDGLLALLTGETGNLNAKGNNLCWPKGNNLEMISIFEI